MDSLRAPQKQCRHPTISWHWTINSKAFYSTEEGGQPPLPPLSFNLLVFDIYAFKKSKNKLSRFDCSVESNKGKGGDADVFIIPLDEKWAIVYSGTDLSISFSFQIYLCLLQFLVYRITSWFYLVFFSCVVHTNIILLATI